jgi:hypothetical protein
MFATYPDQYGAQQIAMLTWGGAEALYGLAPNEVPVVSFPFDGSFLWAPQSNTAGYLRNWMENSTPYYSLWGQTLNQRNALAFLAVDPRVADVTYSNQPTQYYFNTSSSATCASTTGWPCHQFRGDMMISRGPWLAGGSPNLSASLLHAEFQTFTNDYDVPCPGSMRFYKAGPLLDPDSNNLGMVSGDCSVTADIPQFGGAQSDYYDEFLSGLENNETSVGKVEIAYAGGQGLSGSFSSQYGDSQSRFAYVSGNLAPAYNQSNLGISVSYANRSILDSKAPGGDQFEFRLDDIYVSPSTPTKVATHTHYPQTGQSLNTPNGVTIPTGSTVCVNSSYTAVACSGLNSNRLIEEKEDGGEYSGHQPARVYGLMSWWTSPGTITLNWDIPGTFNISNTPPQPQASPSNTYTDGSVTGNGYSNRVTEACGSSVGASFSGECTILEVHKVMQSLSDSTFTRTAFNPSSTWTGAQVCGAISCAVGMFGIGNATQTTIPHFTTTHAGTAQYLVAGLTPGPYSVKVNGSAVSGSPFTVPANDTSLMFESTAGTVSVSAGASPSPTVSSTISGQATVHGNIIVH